MNQQELMRSGVPIHAMGGSIDNVAIGFMIPCSGMFVALNIGNLRIIGNTIYGLNANEDLIFQAAGDGYILSNNSLKLAAGKNIMLTNGCLQCKGAAPVFFDVITADGYLKPVETSDTSAPNSSVYYSNNAGKLVYKNSGGTIKVLEN